MAALDHDALHQRIANPHHDPAIDLPLMCQRIQNRSRAVRAGELSKTHLTGFHIDLDFGDLYTKRRFGPRLEIFVKPMATNF